MTIKDSLIAPYFIKVTKEGFDLYEDKGFDNKGEAKHDAVGYYHLLAPCIKKIVKLKMAESNDIVSLKGFLSQYESLTNKLVEKL